NKRAIQHATTKYLTGTRFVRVSGRRATCIKQWPDRRRGSRADAVHGVLIDTSLSNAGHSYMGGTPAAAAQRRLRYQVQ
ncbi:MAG: hypothetical protein WBE48_00655, partial [Xanthobacteraceae bacterium]